MTSFFAKWSFKSKINGWQLLLFSIAKCKFLVWDLLICKNGICKDKHCQWDQSTSSFNKFVQVNLFKSILIKQDWITIWKWLLLLSHSNIKFIAVELWITFKGFVCSDEINNHVFINDIIGYSISYYRFFYDLLYYLFPFTSGGPPLNPPIFFFSLSRTSWNTKCNPGGP